ncbi:MAG: hypothetical protein IKH56_05030 [Oscillospiraceae bacterium]|nr:hypothetical protein [Oscillospiraceae bacterium]
MGKYDHLVYNMPPEYHNWDKYASPRCGYRGTAIDPAAKMYGGFTVCIKEDVMEVPHMHHAVDEYLVFTGADLEHFFESFDAEIEVWLGDDPRRMEKVTITEPTIIRVPPNLWHCPINFKRIGKPVCFIPLYLDGNWSKITRIVDQNGREDFRYEGADLRHCIYDDMKKCTFCGKCFSQMAKEAEAAGQDPGGDMLAPFYEMEKKYPRTGDYDRYVYTIKPEYHKWTGDLDGFMTNPTAGFRGEDAMPGSNVYFGYDVILREGQMDEAHIHHAVEEYLIFTGADLTDPFASWDAEVSIMLGEHPDEMEEYTFTSPTIVRIPPNFWHCPIRFKRVGKPVNFIPMYPDGTWSKIFPRVIESTGETIYEYQGTQLLRCRLNSNEKCSFCGRCWTMDKQ